MNELTKLLLVNQDYFNRISLALDIIEELKYELPMKVLDTLEDVLRGYATETLNIQNLMKHIEKE